MQFFDSNVMFYYILIHILMSQFKKNPLHIEKIPSDYYYNVFGKKKEITQDKTKT